MEEATERLVRLFLESKGFLVRTNEKFRADKNKIPEIDIIAIRIKNNGKDNLPDRIVGEVKSWNIKEVHFLEESDKGRFKILFKYRKETEKYIRGKYGKGFKFIIFSRECPRKQKDVIKKLLKKNNIRFCSLEDVIKGIESYSEERGYSNDPELQILRLLKKLKKGGLKN